MTKKMTGLTLVGLMIGVSAMAHASSLVTNGDFETTTSGNGQLGVTTNATGWSINNGGYTFLFAPGTADTSGANGQYGNLQLWGPGNGSANGLPAASPSGGNYIAFDGAFQIQPIYQTISGLTIGQKYDISFNWAAAQQLYFDGPTTGQWSVTLGSDTQSTHVESIADHGFSGWKSQTFHYKASAASEVLTFLGTGTPYGVPPFELLDGVTMVAVPEPSAMVSLFAGMVGLGVVARRRARSAK